jgi:hypothetical protein
MLETNFVSMIKSSVLNWTCIRVRVLAVFYSHQPEYMFHQNIIEWGGTYVRKFETLTNTTFDPQTVSMVLSKTVYTSPAGQASPGHRITIRFVYIATNLYNASFLIQFMRALKAQ